MADHVLTPKTVNNRLIYTGAATAAADATDTRVSNAITVDNGSLLTLIYNVTTVGTATYYTSVSLQGSFDKSTWATLQTITQDANASSPDLASTGVIAKTHVPSTYGDYPYYRVRSFSDAAAAAIGNITILVS